VKFPQIVGAHSLDRESAQKLTGTQGNGNVISTTGDVMKFDQAFFTGRLLKPSTMEEAFTPLKLNSGDTYYGPMDTYVGEGKMSYGLGWDIWEQPRYGKSVGHGGFYVR
jgi:CubicO group peptidase (beta-lactamase class C family)